MTIPKSSWESISLDFVRNWPKRKGYDSIILVVCYLSKMAHFIPTQTVADAVKVAELFIDNILKLHGLSKIIISDRDPKFWKSVFETRET